MISPNFVSLLSWILLCFVSKIAITSCHIVIEGFYNIPDNDNILEANNIQHNGTSDDWEPVSIANVVSTFPLFKSTIVQFVIRTTTTKFRTKTYRFDTVKFRNVTNTGTINETIWLGSLKPITRRVTNPKIISWSTINRHQKYHPIGFASIYERSGRIYSVTFTTDTTVYDVVYNTVLQTYNIRSQRWQDFGSEDGSTNNDTTIADIASRSSLMNVTFAVSHILNPSKESWFSIERTSSSERLHKRHLSRQLTNSTGVFNNFNFRASHHMNMVNDTAQIQNYDNNRNEEIIRTLQSSEPVVIDVLVIVSHRAMCEFAGQGASCTNSEQNRNLITTRIKRVEAETNNAWKSINVAIRLVRILFLDINGWDPTVNDFHLNYISTSSDIQQWRKDVGADLIAVIGRKSDECGIAAFGEYSSITGQNCLAQYSMSHEIGHNFAADHNKENADGSTSTFAFGYRKDGTYRTIMSSECDIVSCPRVPYFSSATIKLPDGRTLGSITQNNLRQIVERAPTVAQYMNTVITYAPRAPTTSPTYRPTLTPITKKPTVSPRPSRKPTSTPTGTPTITRYPSSMPSQLPSNVPTSKPTIFLSCQKSTCRDGRDNLIYRRFTLFGRRYCITHCTSQIRYFLFATILRFKCGRCND